MLIRGDAKRIPLADNSVQCVVTSPPYWGLRKYSGDQESVWNNGKLCKLAGHLWGGPLPGSNRGGSGTPTDKNGRGEGYGRAEERGTVCLECGAWRGSYGLEPTIEMYVQHSVLILEEIRRVLRPDGVCFWNIGDSYAASGMGGNPAESEYRKQATNAGSLIRGHKAPAGLKPKDLCLIPSRVAIAAQAVGWWVRSDIIWNKPNPMPESVTDRPTDAYEHILMLTKSSMYYWNSEAVKEAAIDPDRPNLDRGSAIQGSSHLSNNPRVPVAPRPSDGKRNLRNVWTFSTQPYSGAHFATFPVELVIRCLSAATKPGDLVMDPFGGSGTVGEVAFNMGRRFVLIDLAYQALQRERIPPMALNGFLVSGGPLLPANAVPDGIRQAGSSSVKSKQD